MKRIKFFRQFLIAVSTYLIFSASACTIPGLRHSVIFDPNSSTIGAQGARELVEWFIDWRDGRGISYALVFSNSITGDDSLDSLSKERIKSIALLLDPLTKGNIEIKYGDIQHAGIPKKTKPSFLNEIDISLQPTCAETRTCCGGNMK